ncbi:hypothetical protein B0H14DRAFT_3493521 [Mycena olivaceomarginata]|nr:hypothetical protein B0H14DRAFT_3493521 [Mycena olivaceomarginata]
MSASNTQRFFEINDGIGGLGGRGATKTASTAWARFLSPISLTIYDFCQQFKLSEEISRLLQEKGFETPRMLLEVDDGALREGRLRRCGRR